MTQLFNGVNFDYRSVEVYQTFRSYLLFLSESETSRMADSLNYTGVLPR